MAGDLIAEYRRRGWTLVPIPAQQKGPTTKGWQTRNFSPADFPPGCNIGLILGPRSGETVDIDLDCAEALALADAYLPPTGAEFGRASKPRAHRFYLAPAVAFEAFVDPTLGDTLLELRARGATGGEHQTLLPPSIADAERREWCSKTVAPAIIGAASLRTACSWLAIASLVRRHVSEAASERPSADLPHLLWEAAPPLGRAAYRWLKRPPPDEPRHGFTPRPRGELTRAEIDLAELVAAIPNIENWHGWVRIGTAIYSASGGSDQGGVIFGEWSAKSPKYNSYTTSTRWRHFHRSPPDRIGVGTLIHLAKEAGWCPRREVG